MQTFVVTRTTEREQSQDKPPYTAAVWCDSLDGLGYWIVTLADVDALLRLAGAVGHELVIRAEANRCPGLPQIEIYDGYRE